MVIIIYCSVLIDKELTLVSKKLDTLKRSQKNNTNDCYSYSTEFSKKSKGIKLNVIVSV